MARAVRLSDAATGPPDGDTSNGDGAEFYRAEIYQAAGAIMVQLGVSIEVATVRLRSHAFATGRPVDDVARDIVRHRLRVDANND
jgi:ANTAR domain